MGQKAKLGISAPSDINPLELDAGGPGFHFDAQRNYFSYMPSSLNSRDVEDDIAKGRISVISVKPGDWTDAKAIAAKFKTACQGLSQEAMGRVTVQHEPEDNCSGIPNGGNEQILGTADEFKRMQVACGEALQQVNADRDKKILYVYNPMSWSVYIGNAERLFADDAGYDVIAFDGYCWNGRPYRSPEDIFDDNRDFAESKGLGFAINETGVGSTFGTRRVPWVHDLWTYCKREDVKCRWACYWQSSAQFELTTPAGIDSLAWRP